MFELFIFGPARLFLDSLEPDERLQVARLLEIIRRDPYNDGVHKHPFHVPPAVASLYSDGGRYWIVYHLVGNTTVNVWNIGYARDTTGPWREVVND